MAESWVHSLYIQFLLHLIIVMPLFSYHRESHKVILSTTIEFPNCKKIIFQMIITQLANEIYSPTTCLLIDNTHIHQGKTHFLYIYLAYLLILHHAPSSKQNLLHIYMTISIFIIANIRTCEKIFTQIALTFYIQQYEWFLL